MRAVCWEGTGRVAVEKVADPHVVNPRDAVVRVTRAAICGSDLHLYDGYVPTMKRGDVLGHEFMGQVVEAGRESGRRVGERVVVPFAIACGDCWFCRQGLWSLCDNSNPNARMAEGMNGFASAGLFGYSHLYGGYAGGQAEYVRVPFADVGPVAIPDDVSDEQALFLGDILPTGWQAAEQAEIRPDDIVAVWGCGPVGLFAMKAAWLLGAGRVIAIDRFDDRLEKARSWAKAEPLDYRGIDVVEQLKELTGGRGPDVCIDAVGMEAHGHTMDARFDRVMQAARMEMDRPHVLREAIQACRKGGTVSIPGVYIGFIDRFPMGVAFAKGLTLRMGQTHVHRYMRPLLDRIRRGEIDSAGVISHRVGLDDVPAAYRAFRDKQEGVIKVVIRP